MIYGAYWDWSEFHMKQREIIELALERLIFMKLEPGVTEEEIAEIDKKIKKLGELYAKETFKEYK